jgi:hypothetical protein
MATSTGNTGSGGNGARAKKKARRSRPGTAPGRYVYAGFDSEYTERDRPLVHGIAAAVEKRNHILSYQIYGINGEATWEDFALVNDRRWTFRELVIRIIETGIKSGALKQRPARLYLCAHFSRADICTLADFQSVVRDLDFCRNTLTTIGKPVTVSWSDDHHNAHEVEVYLRDSFLLTPEGRKSLEVVGELIGIPKVDIGGYDKKRMDILL